ncbi:hypothetical protein [Rhizorhabdus argentea]|uniref:hypothetical protein n=1 Tax=Rhizorhabdus argentea TaxID=1387174 RepID=UPI0030ED3385
MLNLWHRRRPWSFNPVESNGASAHPLHVWLKSNANGILGTEGIQWTFTKFLIDRNGAIVCRYAPTTKPEAIRPCCTYLAPGHCVTTLAISILNSFARRWPCLQP